MDLKEKILSLTSNDNRGVESALWRLAKSRVCRKDQFDSLLSLGRGAEEILRAITQSFDLSRCPEQENSKEIKEKDDLYQTQEKSRSSHYGNVDFHEMILGQEGPGTPADDMLDFSQHDLLWLQGPGDIFEVCPVSAGICHQPTLLECDEEILEEEMLL
ncbi:hypothetical protein BGX38DRAFT_300851 [Terfezia claveryi]|nr:hypothetical protein BGX38DRAFT_300851 [Terfezia claveryi]